MSRAICMIIFSFNLILLCGCGQNESSSTTEGIETFEYQTLLPSLQTPPLDNQPTNVQQDDITDNRPINTSPNAITYVETSLICQIYVETTWGSNPTEFGYRSERTVPGRFPGPHEPAFNEKNDMFIADPINNRIMKYPNGDNNPQIIEIPTSYVLDIGSYDIPWSNVSVSNDSIFLIFLSWSEYHDRVVQKLAVLSHKGSEQRIINLDPYYPLRSILSTPVLSDKKGGVYVLLDPAGMVHYNDKFQAEFIYLGSDTWYEGIYVGWNGILYTYNSTLDMIHNWGPAEKAFIPHGESYSIIKGIETSLNLETPNYFRFLGVDVQGQFYFKFKDRNSELWLIRLDSSGQTGVLGKVGKIDDQPILSVTLSPDGSLYNLSYDPQDSEVQPQIIKCVFE